jgi:ribosomal protein S18 acetylase RimI-like enzyme
MEHYRLEERPPPLEDYQRLRQAVGWEEVDRKVVRAGLESALYSVTLFYKDEVIGCGRVVGDGGIYFYIQDIIVMPEHQMMGLGKGIMERVMGYIRSKAGRHSFVGLMAAEGVAAFYERYGFAERPPGRPGMYRMWKAQS